MRKNFFNFINYIMSLSKNWVFTLNNYTPEHEATLHTTDIEYIYFGYEIAPTTGTPHLQGYVRFKTKKRLQTIKNAWNMPTIHLETMKGTKGQNAKYCSKDGKIYERGEWVDEQGKRTDLDTCRTLAIESGMRAVSATCNLQQIKVAEKYLTYNEECRDWKPKVTWIWGSSGSGKSRKAREITGNDDCFTKNDGTIWWDGYDGHEFVIIDDFRASWWSLTEMLSLLDRYEKRVQFKGGWRQFRPKTIIITCIFPPDKVYSHITEEPLEQLLRRIDNIIHLVPFVPEVGGNTKTPTSLNNPEEDNIL